MSGGALAISGAHNLDGVRRRTHSHPNLLALRGVAIDASAHPDFNFKVGRDKWSFHEHTRHTDALALLSEPAEAQASHSGRTAWRYPRPGASRAAPKAL